VVVSIGVPLDKVVVRLGDSTFPVSSGSGGRWEASGAASGVFAACVKLREAIAQKLGFNPATVVFEGRVRDGARSVTLAEAASGADIVAEDAIESSICRDSSSKRASGRSLSRSASTPTPPRSGSDARSRYAPLAASSTRRRRAWTPLP